jgi:hypothetical protein
LVHGAKRLAGIEIVIEAMTFDSDPDSDFDLAVDAER